MNKCDNLVAGVGNSNTRVLIEDALAKLGNLVSGAAAGNC
jgi:hypothetical protein